MCYVKHNKHELATPPSRRLPSARRRGCASNDPVNFTDPTGLGCFKTAQLASWGPSFLPVSPDKLRRLASRAEATPRCECSPAAPTARVLRFRDRLSMAPGESTPDRGHAIELLRQALPAKLTHELVGDRRRARAAMANDHRARAFLLEGFNCFKSRVALECAGCGSGGVGTRRPTASRAR
jgi:hypothetical protein